MIHFRSLFEGLVVVAATPAARLQPTTGLLLPRGPNGGTGAMGYCSCPGSALANNFPSTHPARKSSPDLRIPHLASQQPRQFFSSTHPPSCHSSLISPAITLHNVCPRLLRHCQAGQRCTCSLRLLPVFCIKSSSSALASWR